MANTPATKVVKGTITTDGAGAGSASIVTTGYGVGRIRLSNISLTGGTWSAIDNNGTPGTTFIAAVAPTVEKVRGKTIATAITPLVIAVAGGGATKQMRYEVHLEKIDTNDGDLLIHADANDLDLAQGATVTQWNDTSGKNNHLTDIGGGANATTYERGGSAGAGGRRALKFTGGANSSALTKTGLPTSPDWSVIVVARATSNPANFGRAFSLVSASGEIYQEATTGDIGFHSPQVRTGVDSQDWHILSYTQSATQRNAFVDGVRAIAQDGGASPAAATSVKVGRGQASEGWSGYVSEVYVFQKILTDQQREAIEQNLASKWGISYKPRPYFGPGNLVAWFDFDDKATLWQDTARTVPIGTTSDMIQGVTNKAPGATQHLATTGSNPGPRRYVMYNQRAVGYFDSHPTTSSQSTRLTATGLTARANQTIFIIANKRSEPTVAGGSQYSNTNLLSLGTDAQVLCTFHGTSEAEWIYIRNQGGGNDASLNIDPVGWKIISMTATAASVTARINGGAVVSGALDPNDAVTTNTDLILGGNTGVTLNSADAEIGELLIYNAVLTNAQMDLVGNYLASKWGLTWTAVS